MNYTDARAATAEALADPRPGDRFHECYSFWVYVVAVEGPKVAVMMFSPPCMAPRDGKLRVFYSRADFVSHMDYLLLADRDNDVAGWMTDWPNEGPPDCELCAELMRLAMAARMRGSLAGSTW